MPRNALRGVHSSPSNCEFGSPAPIVRTNCALSLLPTDFSTACGSRSHLTYAPTHNRIPAALPEWLPAIRSQGVGHATSTTRSASGTESELVVAIARFDYATGDPALAKGRIRIARRPRAPAFAQTSC